jgi:hypothetical protein
MQSDHETGFPTLNGLSGPGRPTKRTKKVVTELLDAISAGAPFNLACQAAGIGHQTFQDWRRRDPAFALQVDQAAARGTIGRLKEIEAQGKDGAWQALSWLCERRHPAEFAKPEVALNIGIQNNLTAQGTSGSGFESLVVSDLEFLGLRKREGYEHRPGQREAREVPGEITVEPALSGTLNREDHPNGAVISESQASANAKRVSKVDEKIEELLKAKRAGNGSHAAIPEPAAAASNAMVSAPIVMPVGDPSPGWWSQLSQGDNSRTIAKEAAVYVCRTLVREVMGGLAAQSTTVEFESEVVTLRDLHSVIQDLMGPKGWSALVRKGGRDA